MKATADEIMADIKELQARMAKADAAYKYMLQGWIWDLMGDLAGLE